jgi:DNA modification methylase
MCGDATSTEDMAQLLGGQRADLCLTDPPYGAGIEYADHDDSEQVLVELAKAWLPVARKNSAVVVFTPGITRQWLYPEPAWVMCWFYGGGQHLSPWGFNCWQPMLCYGKDPSLAAGRGARPDAVNMNIPASAGHIDHPCPKPMALWEWLISERLCLRGNELVLDPFLGSGTTLIAAARNGRRCFGIEISPAYVDVIRARWTAYAKSAEIDPGPGALE